MSAINVSSKVYVEGLCAVLSTKYLSLGGLNFFSLILEAGTKLRELSTVV